MHHGVSRLRGPRIVGHHEDRLVQLAVELRQQAEDLSGRFPVEVARRLVRDEQRRIADDRPRDRDALLLSPRELPRIVLGAVREADERQGGRDVLAALLLGELREQERKLDVLVGGEDRNQVVELEDESDVAGPPPGQLTVGELGDVLAVDDDRSRRRPVDPCDQVEERALPEPDGPISREELSPATFRSIPSEDRMVIASRL
jgi:hypothetical protein